MCLTTGLRRTLLFHGGCLNSGIQISLGVLYDNCSASVTPPHVFCVCLSVVQGASRQRYPVGSRAQLLDHSGR